MRLVAREERLVRWTTSQIAATIIMRSCPPPENRASAVRTLTFRISDAAQTIPTFCPGFSRTSRIVRRSADYWRVLARWGVRRISVLLFFRGLSSKHPSHYYFFFFFFFFSPP